MIIFIPLEKCILKNKMDSKNYAKVVFHSFEAKNLFNETQTFYHRNEVISVLKLNESEYERVPAEFLGKSTDGHIGISKEGLQFVEKYSKVPFNSNKYC